MTPEQLEIANRLKQEADAYHAGERSRTMTSIIIEFNEQIPTATEKDINRWLSVTHGWVSSAKKKFKLNIPRSVPDFTARSERIRKETAARPPRPITTASPITRQLFEIMDRDGKTQAGLAQDINVTPNAVTSWRTGDTSPYVINFELAVQAIGYRLVLIKDEPHAEGLSDRLEQCARFFESDYGYNRARDCREAAKIIKDLK